MPKWTLRTRLATGLCLLVLLVVVSGTVVAVGAGQYTAPMTVVGLAVLGAFILAGLIFRDVTGSLRAVVLELESNSEEIASASSQVSQANISSAESAGKQSASIEEASASLEEISSMTQLNAQHAR